MHYALVNAYASLTKLTDETVNKNVHPSSCVRYRETLAHRPVLFVDPIRILLI